jgi:hypothetical protein
MTREWLLCVRVRTRVVVFRSCAVRVFTLSLSPAFTISLFPVSRFCLSLFSACKDVTVIALTR